MRLIELMMLIRVKEVEKMMEVVISSLRGKNNKIKELSKMVIRMMKLNKIINKRWI